MDDKTFDDDFIIKTFGEGSCMAIYYNLLTKEIKKQRKPLAYYKAHILYIYFFLLFNLKLHTQKKKRTKTRFLYSLLCKEKKIYRESEETSKIESLFYFVLFFKPTILILLLNLNLQKY